MDLVLFQTLQTFTLKQLPQQAPQGQGHSNDFLWAFKAAVCQPAKAPNASKIPNPQGQGHSNETFYEFQSCRLLARKGSKLSKTKFQTPSNQGPGTPGPRPLPQQAPQGQATAMAFLGFQSCRLPTRKPSKTLQTLQTLQNPPNPPNTVPSRHLRSTAGVDLVLFQTLQTFTLKQLPPGTPGPGPQQWNFLWISKLPFASPQRLQTFQNKIQTPSPTGTPGPRPLPQQAPHGQGQGHFPNRHPRARPQQWLS